MELFSKVLKMVLKGEINNEEVLLKINQEIIKKFVNDIHLISYLHIYDMEKETWLSKPGDELLFYTDKFSHEQVRQYWENNRRFRGEKKVNTFRHYVYEKGKKKYPLLFITRDSTLREIYPDLREILLQVPVSDDGARLLADELQLNKPSEREGFTTIFIRFKEHFSNWKYIYYYATPIKRHRAVTGTSIFTDNFIPEDQLVQMFLILNLIFENLDLVRIESSLKNFSLRSAIAAIMSRNMSHNIGSHVLARIATKGINGWTQNKGIKEIVDTICTNESDSREKAKDMILWSKDAQILARYIQQRMDFIAQIAAEWPTWTEPAYLLKNVMRWFLSQKQLLNFIAASENLGVHLFHLERHKKNIAAYDGDLRLHIFLSPEKIWREATDYSTRKKEKGISSLDCRLEDLIDYRLKQWEDQKEPETDFPENDESNPGLSYLQRIIKFPKALQHRILLYTPGLEEAECQEDDDILIAIPGGIVGYHAFYIILENIIRNAAKHGFTKLKTNHLDLIIEIFHDPEEKINIYNDQEGRKPAWLVRVYDNVSYIRSEKKPNGVVLWGNPDGEKGINDLLSNSLINDVGGLKREDWGIAEMKIAAGYLQGRTIESIGSEGEIIIGARGQGIQNGELDDEMLKLAAGIKGQRSPIIRAIESPINTLGYEFYIARQRTVGIVGKLEGIL